MSQLVLDDQLDVVEVLPRLLKWITATRLQDLRPGELVLDDRVPGNTVDAAAAHVCDD